MELIDAEHKQRNNINTKIDEVCLHITHYIQSISSHNDCTVTQSLLELTVPYPVMAHALVIWAHS